MLLVLVMVLSSHARCCALGPPQRPPHLFRTRSCGGGQGRTGPDSFDACKRQRLLGFAGSCASLRTETDTAERRHLAPRAGFEPATNRLTAGCSTTELPGNGAAPAAAAGASGLYQRCYGFAKAFGCAWN